MIGRAVFVAMLVPGLACGVLAARWLGERRAACIALACFITSGVMLFAWPVATALDADGFAAWCAWGTCASMACYWVVRP